MLTLSLLAVLAGYGAFFFLHSFLSADSRRLRHQQAVERVRQELLTADAGQSKTHGLQNHLNRLLTPGMVVWIAGERQLPMPSEDVGQIQPLLRLLERTDMSQGGRTALREFRVGDISYVSSSLLFPVDGQTVELRFLSDVSGDLALEHIVQILLLAAALITALITGMLLRPAIRSGLQPLEQLCEQLEAIQTESLAQQMIKADGQPAELIPIIESFNSLLTRLGDAWERQRSFVNGVSHELRTPITIIAGYARRLSRTPADLSIKQQEQIHLIEAESRRMALLVNDLLDLARSDAGHLTLTHGSFDPWQCLESVVGRLQEHAGGRLLMRCDDDNGALHVNLDAYGDPNRVEQCVANLVENALKYTPADSPIVLTCTLSQDGNPILHVIDSGPGVPEQDRLAIFDRFRRGSQSSGIVGSGIGLAVVKTLMSAMGGKVDVVEAPTGGADFRLHLQRSSLQG